MTVLANSTSLHRDVPAVYSASGAAPDERAPKTRTLGSTATTLTGSVLSVPEAMARVAAAVADLEAALLAADGVPVSPHDDDFERPRCDLRAVVGLRAVERVCAMMEARRLRLMVAAAGFEPELLSHKSPVGSQWDVRISDIRAVELAAVMNITPTRARNLAFDARQACGQLTTIMTRLDQGTVSPYHSRLAIDGWRQLVNRFANASVELPANLAARYEARILRRVETRTMSDYKRGISAAVAMLAPQDEAAVRKSAYDERNVHVQPASDGMAYLNAYLGAAEAARIWQALQHTAANDTSLTGTMTQRVADALVAICDGTTETPAHVRQAAAEIQVLVSLDAVAQGRLVGQIEGTDLLVEGSALSELMADAKFRRLVFDPQTGRLLDYGRTTYRPPSRLRDHVVNRDRTCRAPGCTRPARYCDVDHTVAWQDDGTTSDGNLAALCRTHHVLKTHGHWRYRTLPDGTTEWVTPSGAMTARPPADFVDLAPPEPPF